MVTVKHVLADGRILDDISGHIVRQSDAEAVYDLIKRINKDRGRSSVNEEQKTKDN